MANHKSAAKKARRDAEARLRNRASRSSMKSSVKSFLAAVASGDKAKAVAALPVVMGVVDVAERKGVLHKNAANRHKSRFTLKVNAMA